jgi:potassium efflux system protein
LERNALRVRWLGSLVVGLTLSAAFSAVAQDAPPAAPAVPAVPADPAATASAEPAVELIAVPEIAVASEKLQQSLRRVGESVAVDSGVAAVEAELPAIGEQNSLRLQQTEALLASRPSLDQLRDFESDWTRRVNALVPRRRVLARRAVALEDQVEELGRLRTLWSATLENAARTQAPREVLAAAESNLSEIEGISKKVHARRGIVLTLLTAVSEREFEASDAGQRIAAARAELRARLLEPDGEPLWTALRARRSGHARDAIREAITSEWRALVELLEDRRREIVPVAVAFPLSLVLAIYVRRRMKRRMADGRLEGAASAFERPISVAFLLTSMAAAATFPFAPGIAWDVIGVVLAVPILRIVTPVFPDATRGVLWTLALFYIVDRVRDLIAPAELLERAVFFGEMVAAIAFVGTLIRPGRLDAFARESLPPATVGVGLRIALGAFGVAAFSILLGYVSFGKLVGEGALGSIYLALVAYAAYRIGTTLAFVALTSSRLEWIGVLRQNSERIVGWARQGLAILAALFWGLGTLDAFAIRDSVVGGLQAFLSMPFEVGTLSISLGDVLAFPLTLLIAYTLSRAIRALLEEDLFPRVKLRRGVGNAVSTSVHYVLLLGGFFLALGAAGIDLGRFTLLAGAFGVGIGFGLQNVVNNFVSGLILLYERPIQIGDMIELGGLLGEVKSIGIRASTVVTFQGAEVIIPNGNLLSDQLVNWTLSNQHRRVEVPVGVAYGNRPAEVVEILKRVVERDERILRQPEPLVLFRGFGNSSLDFEIRFWASDYRTYLMLQSDVASAVYDELERVGIKIPFPQRDLHLKSVDPAAAAKLRGGDDAS